jgi:hypothetical protein
MSLKRTYQNIPITYRFKSTQRAAFHDQDHFGSKFVLSWCITDGYGKKEYIAVEDETSYFELINTIVPEHRRFSELIREDSASRVHFDADLSYKDISGDELSHYQFLQGVCQFIILFMKDYYGIVITMSDLHITKAYTNRKMSFHILLPYKFKDLESRRQFKTCLMYAKLNLEDDGTLMYKIMKINSSLDDTIYSENRVLRLMENCKDGQNNFLKHINELRDYSTNQPTMIFAK